MCLFCRSSDLRSDKLLEVADRVVGVALHADLLAEAVVAMKAQVSQALWPGESGNGMGTVPDYFDHDDLM